MAVRPNVVVAEHSSAGDMAGPSLPEHRIPDPRGAFLSLDLRAEIRGRQHEFIGRAVERDLLLVEIGPDFDARERELLHDIADLELLSPEPRQFAHDQNV